MSTSSAPSMLPLGTGTMCILRTPASIHSLFGYISIGKKKMHLCPLSLYPSPLPASWAVTLIFPLCAVDKHPCFFQLYAVALPLLVPERLISLRGAADPWMACGAHPARPHGAELTIGAVSVCVTPPLSTSPRGLRLPSCDTRKQMFVTSLPQKSCSRILERVYIPSRYAMWKCREIGNSVPAE